jgi:hypothetical protein
VSTIRHGEIGVNLDSTAVSTGGSARCGTTVAVGWGDGGALSDRAAQAPTLPPTTRVAVAVAVIITIVRNDFMVALL